MKKHSLIVLILISILIISLFGCFPSDGEYYGDNDYDVSDIEIVVNDNTLEKKTLTTHSLVFSEDYDKIKKFESEIFSKTESLGGTVLYEYHSSDGNNFVFVKLVIKIPTEKVDDFTDSIKKGRNLSTESSFTKDVTSDYNDKIDKINYINAQLEVYNSLSEDENATVSDKLVIMERQKTLTEELKKLQDGIKAYEGGAGSLTKIDLEIGGYSNEADISSIVLSVIFCLIVVTIIVLLVLKNKKNKNKIGNKQNTANDNGKRNDNINFFDK